jgi:hypothetical protein
MFAYAPRHTHTRLIHTHDSRVVFTHGETQGGRIKVAMTHPCRGFRGGCELRSATKLTLNPGGGSSMRYVQSTKPQP